MHQCYFLDTPIHGCSAIYPNLAYVKLVIMRDQSKGVWICYTCTVSRSQGHAPSRIDT
jgi:hypothetical protein